jgi:hypothetical protein
MTQYQPRAGDAVQLVNTDIPRLEGQRGEVLEVTEWGAHVETAAAATGRFRAHHSEMAPYDPPPALKPKPSVREAGYSGEICPVCNGCRMRRNGSCQLCEDCGSTTGCS